PCHEPRPKPLLWLPPRVPEPCPSENTRPYPLAPKGTRAWSASPAPRPVWSPENRQGRSIKSSAVVPISETGTKEQNFPSPSSESTLSRHALQKKGDSR